jgi:hypothetical protein
VSVRLYFDLDGFQALISDSSILNIETFKVYEGESKDGNFHLIKSIDYNPKVPYVTVPAFVAATSVVATIDGYSNEFNWFKLSYLAGYQGLVSVAAEVVPVSGVSIVHTLASYPVQVGSIVLKDNDETMFPKELGFRGDVGDGTIEGDNISAAVIDYTTGVVTATLVTVPVGVITADYTHYSEYQIESATSDAILAENLATILTEVRIAIQDTDEDDPAFSDDELIRKVKEGIRRFTGVPNIVITEEFQLSIIILLVRISCCYDLAYHTARYYHLELPDGIRMFRGEIPKHYMELAKALERQYAQLVEDIGNEDGTVLGIPTFEVVDCTRKSYFKSPRHTKPETYDSDIGPDTTIEGSRWSSEDE